MACLSSRAPLRSFSAFQSTLRSSRLNQRRSFSASQPKSFALIDCIVWGPNAVLDGFHSLGLPWYAAIPASAVLIRSTCGYIFNTRDRDRGVGITAQLTPVVQAQYRNELVNTPQKMRDYQTQASAERVIKSAVLSSLMRMQMLWRFSKRFSVLGRFANFFALLASAQTIRMKSGGRNGVLGLLNDGIMNVSFHLDNWSHRLDQSLAPYWEKLYRAGGMSEERIALWSVEVQKKHEQCLARWSEKMDMGKGQQVGATDGLNAANAADLGQNGDNMVAGMSNSLQSSGVPSPYFDPSLQTEGFAWIQDLTMIDTSLTLPCILYGVGIFAIMYRPSARGASSIYWFLPSTDWSKKLSLSVSTFFFMVSLQWPAAILLYLIPSFITGYVQNLYMNIVAPTKSGFRACKRPLRMKSRQQFTS